jgi:hypothetical protein
MKRILPLSLLLLAACGTPQEQCIAGNTRDLRTVNKLIAEAEGNLKRGYAIETKTERYRTFEPCLLPGGIGPDGKPLPPRRSMCPDTDTRTYKVPKSIDLDLEATKLKQLKTKRKELERAAEKVVAQCKAQYPE